jgi:hypothetical protein
LSYILWVLYIQANAKVSDKRRWRRIRPQGSVPRVGKISLGPNVPFVDCRVIDLSAGGASLELQRHHDVPNKFEFIYGNAKRVCYLAWVRGLRIGISYEESYQRSGISGGLNRPSVAMSSLSRKRR